ncbi:cysteine/serine-rich nuclear protein 2 [Oncorhynchus tshawytscha]|uniref:Cysteine/serine-rich nuclear protein N-terminal domain-containing protein n=1 Tax=Oncorhynchus tshawytscha TaxID=74940 RepID=A0AAZ3P508_ONCTS|nr:cysteine/serine-rich nuclear protein 2 [Oncorhynchus tshawytscha]
MLARAMNGLLKRKFEEVCDEDQCYSSSSSLSSSAYSGWDSEGESCYSDTLDSTPSNPGSPDTHYNTKSILKKAKCEQGGRGNVTFDMLTVFLFPRCQGFSSVPSRGGCSLGMMQRHSALRRYTLDEYAVEQHTLRREKLLDRLREEKLDALKQKLTKGGTVESEEADRLTVEDIPEDEMDISSCNLDDGSFLHPYPSKRRHALLKAAGVKVEKEEKRQLQQLRVSREDCGCDCQGFCEPETCACSLAGIKCQMDHSSFPCGCTKDGCGNQEGRKEFNSSRVQTHYIHTIMKLELEKRLEETSGPEEEDLEETAPCHYYNPLSNRSSFHFISKLAAVRENSCSSDMTDSSASSGGSESSEEGAELVVGLGRRSREDGPLRDDVDENGLSRILSFSDIDDNNDYNVNNRVVNDNRCCPEQCLQQQPWMLTGFITADFQEDNNNLEVHRDNRAMAITQLLDDNANQGNALFHHSGCSVPNMPSFSVDSPNTPSSSVDCPNTPSSSVDCPNNPSSSVDCPNNPSSSVDCPNNPSSSVDCPNNPSSSVDGTAASLSSESDLEFFDGFCLGPSSLYNSLKEYQHMDSFFHCQLPSYPSSQSQASDPGACLLESLIGLSESVPEPPATFRQSTGPELPTVFWAM